MRLSTIEKIRAIAKRKKLSLAQIAQATGQTRQNLSNKMEKGNLREGDLEAIAEAMDCELIITFIDRQTGERY